MPTTIYTCQGCGKTDHDKNRVLQGNCNCELNLPDTEFLLSEYCSTYYALAFLSLENPDRWKQQFQDFSKKLATEFFNYTIKVAGGEARNYYGESVNEPILNQLDPEIAFVLRENHETSRVHMFNAWERLGETKTPVELLSSLVFFFKHGNWKAGFGGRSWAEIAEVALAYTKGETTPVIFVDSCWGLRHNNNCFLDKLYPIPQCLIDLLDAGRAENMRVIYKALPDGEIKDAIQPYLPSSPVPEITEKTYPWELGSVVWAPYKNLKNPKEGTIVAIHSDFVTLRFFRKSYGKIYSCHWYVTFDKILTTKPKKIVTKKSPFIPVIKTNEVYPSSSLFGVPVYESNLITTMPKSTNMYIVDLETMEEKLCTT
jgi:hypothetical protein